MEAPQPHDMITVSIRIPRHMRDALLELAQETDPYCPTFSSEARRAFARYIKGRRCRNIVSDDVIHTNTNDTHCAFPPDPKPITLNQYDREIRPQERALSKEAGLQPASFGSLKHAPGDGTAPSGSAPLIEQLQAIANKALAVADSEDDTSRAPEKKLASAKGALSPCRPHSKAYDGRRKRQAKTRHRKARAKDSPAVHLARRVLRTFHERIQTVEWASVHAHLNGRLEALCNAPPLALIEACEELDDFETWDAGLTTWLSFEARPAVDASGSPRYRRTGSGRVWRVLEGDPLLCRAYVISLWRLLDRPKADPEGARFIERLAMPQKYDDWTEIIERERRSSDRAKRNRQTTKSRAKRNTHINDENRWFYDLCHARARGERKRGSANPSQHIPNITTQGGD